MSSYILKTAEDGLEVILPAVPSRSDYRLRATSTIDATLFDQSDRPFTITGGEPENAIDPARWMMYE